MKQVQGYYFKVLSIVGAAVILTGGSGIAGYYLGKGKSGYESDAENRVNLDTFWQAWDSLDENFFGQVDDKAKVDGAIRGMVSSLKDPYTIYLEPKEDKLFRSDLEGSFSGIGAELSMRDNLLTVDGVLDGSPAQKAGVKSKDIILEIDGVKSSDLSFLDAIDKIRGEKGTTVTLTIARKDEEKTQTITITRDTITIKSISTESLGAEQEIAYIKVSQFGDDTAVAFRDALTAAKNSGKKGILIDLRGNPGGFLHTAADLIGMVLPAKVESDQANLKERVAVVERDKNGKEQLFKATTNPVVADMPLVVLVDDSSASASEIFAGAMKDYKRGTVVGVKTFGKGSVQNLIKLNNGGSIKVTIAKWFTPLGVGIDGTGIEPDVTVELPEDGTPSTSDAQVQKALELLVAARN